MAADTSAISRPTHTAGLAPGVFWKLCVSGARWGRYARRRDAGGWKMVTLMWADERPSCDGGDSIRLAFWLGYRPVGFGAASLTPIVGTGRAAASPLSVTPAGAPCALGNRPASALTPPCGLANAARSARC